MKSGSLILNSVKLRADAPVKTIYAFKIDQVPVEDDFSSRGTAVLKHAHSKRPATAMPFLTARQQFVLDAIYRRVRTA